MYNVFVNILASKGFQQMMSLLITLYGIVRIADRAVNLCTHKYSVKETISGDKGSKIITKCEKCGKIKIYKLK